MSRAWIAAAGLLAGIGCGVMTAVRPGDALAAAVAAAALALLAPSRRGAGACLAAGGLAVAVAHGAAARDRAIAPPLAGWFDTVAGLGDRAPDLTLIDGVIARDAQVVDGVVDDGVRLVVDVARVAPAGGPWRPARGRAQVHVAGAQAPGHVREWRAGRRLRAPVAFRRPQTLANFGGPSPFWQALRRPFALTGSIKSAALVEIERGGWWAEAAAGARWRARDAAARFIAPRDRQAAAVAVAILIGDRAGLDDDLERRLQRAGTYHVIAISGGNVALLIGLSYLALRLAIRSPRIAAAATLAVALAYGWTVAGDPSVARAVTAAGFYLGAAVCGIWPNPLATLRTAACALALADPVITSDVGAWLSFGATLGILLAAGRFVAWAPWTRMAPRVQRTLRPIAVVLAATIAAELALIPIAAAVFGRVTVAGLALNLVAIPAMAVVQTAGVVAALAGPVLPLAGHAAGGLVGVAASVLTESARLVDVWPWLSWRVPSVATWSIAIYYGAAAVAWSARGRRRLAATGVAAAALALIVTSPGTTAAQPAAGRLRLTMFDVGQGDAMLVQTPSGQALLIDTGGAPGGFDIGGRIVAPAVWATGARRVTWLALTHGDRDHAGGAATVMEDLSPAEIWEGVAVPPDADRRRLTRLAAARGVPWRTIRAGARLEVGGVTIDAIHPPEPDWERQRVRNDDSLVLRVRYGNVDLLLTGDAGAEFESRLPPALGERPIRILKAGHHGSATSTSAALMAAVRPQVVLISVGRGNLFGHPAPAVLARIAASGAEVLRTDRDGAVSLETDGERVEIRSAYGRRWSIVSSVRGAPREPGAPGGPP